MHIVLQSLLTFCLIYQYKCNETYTTKYDGVDLDEILASERLLAGYVNCLLDKGPCTPDGKELKSELFQEIAIFYCQANFCLYNMSNACCNL